MTREKAVAEENMLRADNSNGKGNVLDEIMKVLLELGIDKEEKRPAPTKQG